MAEIREAFFSVVEKNETLVALFEEFDRNGDGVIDFEEFVEMVKTPPVD